MAVIVRTRRLSNPSHRRKRRSNAGKRRMTLKQKLHFGSARQRAAARLALRGRKNPSIRRTKKQYKKKFGFLSSKDVGRFAYHGTKRGGSKGKPLRKFKRRRKNVGEIVSISLAGLAGGNPGRKKRRVTRMARRRRRNTAHRVHHRRRANPTKVYRRRRRVNVGGRRRRRNTMRAYHRRRRNPTYRIRRMNRGHRRRRNPGFGGGITSGVIGTTLGVIGGAIGSKYITQLALGGNNTGIMGYGGNLVATIALAWGASKITKKPSFGTSVLAGGLAALVLRVLQDNTSIGQYVNLSLSGIGKGGDMSLGIIQDSSFPVPQVAQPGSMTKFIVPAATRQYVSSQTAQMAKAGSSGMGYVMGGRKVRRAIM